MKRLAAILFRTLLIATFALWFGGFTFYVSFVVPVGTEVLGSARSQGFITQQVTNWLNVVCGFALAAMIIESIRGKVRRSKPGGWMEFIQLTLIVGFLIALIWIHPFMDEMINPGERALYDRNKFYGLHRIYLWISTFQWVAAWIWLFLVVCRWQGESLKNGKIP